MLYINVYKAQNNIPKIVKGYFVKFENIDILRGANRRAFLQSIVSSLNRENYDSSVAPEDLSENFDIVLLNVPEDKLSRISSKYKRLGPSFTKVDITRKDIIERAWKNRVRIDLLKRGLLKIGDRYILEEDVLDRTNKFKRAFRVQAAIIDNSPSIYVDPRIRVMIPLGDKGINQADEMGEESKIYVRVLPHWQKGILIGTTGKKAAEMQFPIGNKTFPGHKYWRIKHNIRFIKPHEAMLNVYVAAYEKKLPYPESCVFAEFKRRASLPDYLKKDPHTRVDESLHFIRKYFSSTYFLGKKLIFKGPVTTADLCYHEYIFPSQSSFQVVVGNGMTTTIKGLHKALRRHGPYSGRFDGKYVVVHYGDEDKILKATLSLRKIYSALNLGKLTPVSIGKAGLIDTGGESVADYTSTIAELRTAIMEEQEKVIVLIVLPDAYSSEIYFKSRAQLFERVFGAEPIPAQAISYTALEKVASGHQSSYAICVNTASQCYIKLGGTGTAVWILKDPADISIPGVERGSSCYAYHDVSRRPKIKASATAYSALTDSYGRYIATGAKPIGGEKLTPSNFYDILVELIQKVSVFVKRYGVVGRDKRFRFRRLVFAKDGVIRDEEANMMAEVITNGLPDERKPPIPQLLKKIPMLPEQLVIDIISVNKTPNKRIFKKVEDKFLNVMEGTAISYDENTGLLVSCSSHIGTVQPIEISLCEHLCLNGDSIPRPHISQIMDEYYRLTFLNWSSVFKQGKYALPQILTQNLGENISAGVFVPDDMILL